jgi:hypothetical protein
MKRTSLFFFIHIYCHTSLDLGPGRLWTVVDDTNNYDCDLFEFKRSSKSPAADLVDEELRRKESVHTAPFSSEEPARNNQQHRRDQHEETRSDGSSVSSSRRGDLLLRNKAGSIRLPSEGKFVSMQNAPLTRKDFFWTFYRLVFSAQYPAITYYWTVPLI